MKDFLNDDYVNDSEIFINHEICHPNRNKHEKIVDELFCCLAKLEGDYYIETIEQEENKNFNNKGAIEAINKTLKKIILLKEKHE